ncbi:unnamed protein product [Adineta ricciae]|uniref:Uncharacterized protein n=1 Tax=Adineta ricciae TaxID=249248 RepID=A0A815KYK7_ADIRI|nr:unnamed protein product [Adineta ricciae]
MLVTGSDPTTVPDNMIRAQKSIERVLEADGRIRSQIPISGNHWKVIDPAGSCRTALTWGVSNIIYDRRTIWGKNLKLVEEHNQRADLGLHSYRLGMNKFADLTNEEFVKLLNDVQKKDIQKDAQPFIGNSNIELPDTVDWRDKGAVVPVKNQGQCGSSWAFSAVGAIEGAHEIKTGKLVSLSEQQLVDCSGKYGNEGCNGGYMTQSFQYIKDAGGIQSDKTYPYTGRDDKCTFNSSDVIVKVCGFVELPSGNETALQQAVALIGPIATAVDSGDTSFQMYKSGVYDDPRCQPKYPNHGIFIVGYGNESGKDYWLLKNSWGTEWGLEGYIKVVRNKNNQCGVATMASYPILC